MKVKMTFFDDVGRVCCVGAMVLESTNKKTLQESLRKWTGELWVLVATDCCADHAASDVGISGWDEW